MSNKLFVVLVFQDVTTDCISKIPSLPVALDGFKLRTVHNLSSNEKIYESQDSNPGHLGEKRKRYLCAMPPPSHHPSNIDILITKIGHRNFKGLRQFAGAVLVPEIACGILICKR